jgi:threonine/homoserine/homoserine lactone efflux protein
VDPNFIAFLGVAVVVVVTPGPDMLLVMRNTLAAGRAVGTATVSGVIVGILTWGLLAAVGVAAVLAASAVAFAALKLAGAAYLVYLGVAALRGHPDSVETGTPTATSLRAAVAQGFVSAALNPKLGVFFLTLLPQFIDASGSVWNSLALAAVFAATGLAWLLVFTQLVGWLGDALARAPIRRRIQQATGVVLIGLGIRVAADR